MAAKTAKSRDRSIDDRYTISPMIPAAIIHMSTAITTMDCTPPLSGRLRSLTTWSFVTIVVPAGARGVPFTAIPIARGWPLNTMFCASRSVTNTVGTPK